MVMKGIVGFMGLEDSNHNNDSVYEERIINDLVKPKFLLN